MILRTRLPYDSASGLVRSIQVLTMILLQAKPPPRIFDPGDYPNTVSSPSLQLNSIKKQTKSVKDWKRNASFGFLWHKAISQSHELATQRNLKPRHQHYTQNRINPSGYSNPIPKSWVLTIVDGQAHPRVLGLQLRFPKKILPTICLDYYNPFHHRQTR